MLTLGIAGPFFSEWNVSLLAVLYWVLLPAWVVLSLYTLLVAVVSMIRVCDGEFSPETAPPMIHRALQGVAIVAALLTALHAGAFWVCAAIGTIDFWRPVFIMLPCAAVLFLLFLVLSWRRDSWDRVRPLLWSALLMASSGALFVLVFALVAAASYT